MAYDPYKAAQTMYNITQNVSKAAKDAKKYEEYLKYGYPGATEQLANQQYEQAKKQNNISSAYNAMTGAVNGNSAAGTNANAGLSQDLYSQYGNSQNKMWDYYDNVFNQFGANSQNISNKNNQYWDTLKYDYKQSAYWEIIDRKREFQNQTSNTIYGVDDKSNALYYFKLAVRYKDKKAALKYLDQYFEHGGTGKGITQSFDMLNPMYGFTGKDTMEKGQEFIVSLNGNEKEKLDIAQKYYESELMLPANITQLLKKKTITNDEAKNLLINYVNSKLG